MDGSILVFLKYMDGSVFAFLKCTDGSVCTHLNGTYGFPLNLLPLDFHSMGFMMDHIYNARKATKLPFLNRMANITLYFLQDCF